MRLPAVVLLTALAVAGCTPASGEAIVAPTTSPSAPSSASPDPATAPPSSTAPPATVSDSPSPTESASPESISPAPISPEPASPEPTSPEPTTPVPIAPAPTGSYVLGDSISLSVAPALSRLGYPVTGRVGQSASTAFLQTYLSTPSAQQAPAWVIILGTNNRGDETDLPRIVEWLQAINDLRTKGAKQHVYWVTPYRSPDYRGGLSTHTLDAFNAELIRADGPREWLDVLDFATAAAEHPEWFAQDGAHLHPDVNGQAALVNLIAGSDVEPADSPAPITDLGIPVATPTPAPVEVTEEEEFFQDFEFTNE